MLRASLVTSAGNCAAAVSKITCRKRWLAVRGIALRLTITTSAQDGSAASARTTAAPTCPVPPMIKTRNAILGLPIYQNGWLEVVEDGLKVTKDRVLAIKNPF